MLYIVFVYISLIKHKVLKLTKQVKKILSGKLFNPLLVFHTIHLLSNTILKPDIKMITLMEYPIKLVVNQKDVLGKMKQLHPEDLMSKPGISYTEGSAMDREINEFFKEQEITPDIHYRTSSEEIQNFVACGLGWAFIAQNGTPMKKGLKILEMPEMTLKRETCLAMRKDRQLSKNAQNFLKFTLSYNENFL